MLLYITLGTNDLARSRAFYAAVMPTLGMELQGADDVEFGYSLPGDQRTRFWVTKPFDGNPATIGNGSMVALTAESRAAVDAFYAAALANGGTDEGAPGSGPIMRISMPAMCAIPMATSFLRSASGRNKTFRHPGTLPLRQPFSATDEHGGRHDGEDAEDG